MSPGAGRGGGGVRMSSSSFFTLNEGDVEAIRNEMPEVQYVAGALRGNSQVVYAENNASTSWQGVQPDFFDINGWTIADGEGFEPQDYSSAGKVVILGDTVRRELFGEDSGIGQTHPHRARAVHRGRRRCNPRARAVSARTRTTWSWCRWKPRAAA